MDTRGSKCGVCRQPLSMATNSKASPCQGCRKLSPEQTIVNIGQSTNNGFDHEQSCPPRLKEFGHWLKNKIFHHKGGGGDPHYESLNYSLSSSGSPNGVRMKKRALLVGVSYKKWKYKLTGTINDVKRMRTWLLEKNGFAPQNIRVLTEEEQNPVLTPTKKNILESLKWLVEDSRRGDSLVFYFSGHGVRQPDFSMDEVDGFDETLCPVDFLEEGMILDNDINSTIVWPLVEGVTLHAIVDACHSGTMLDLVYVYNRKKKEWDDQSPASGSRKHTNGGLAISISACEDNQVAADTTAFSEGNEMNGAMTYMLIEILKKLPGLTYGHLLDMMDEFLHDANSPKCSCRFSKLRQKLFSPRFSQKPLLSASEKFDIYQRHFIL